MPIVWPRRAVEMLVQHKQRQGADSYAPASNGMSLAPSSAMPLAASGGVLPNIHSVLLPKKGEFLRNRIGASDGWKDGKEHDHYKKKGQY